MMTSHTDPYRSLGIGYQAVRKPDRRIARQIAATLGDAGTVLNIGAGADSYDSGDATRLLGLAGLAVERVALNPLGIRVVQLVTADRRTRPRLAVIVRHASTVSRRARSRSRRICCSASCHSSPCSREYAKQIQEILGFALAALVQAERSSP